MSTEEACETPKIFTSCYYQKSVKGENMIFHHAFAYQISGSLVVRDGRDTVVFEPGDFRLNIRNKLAKFAKQPAGPEPFRSLSISFDEPLLREFANEYGYSSDRKVKVAPSIQLKKHPLYAGLVDSIQSYLPFVNSQLDDLVTLKIKEALLVLLKVQPELKNILFDFAAPEKMNLKAFMNQNYKFNVTVERLAYLTGRSLSAFKRDFKAIFNDTPTHWLVQKRLDEAHFLLSEKQQKPSDVYVELGFEDLSHFSFAFKKKFGYSLAMLQKGRKK